MSWGAAGAIGMVRQRSVYNIDRVMVWLLSDWVRFGCRRLAGLVLHDYRSRIRDSQTKSGFDRARRFVFALQEILMSRLTLLSLSVCIAVLSWSRQAPA